MLIVFHTRGDAPWLLHCRPLSGLSIGNRYAVDLPRYRYETAPYR